MTAPGYVCNSRIDIIATNAMARALLSPVFEFARATGTTPNTARFVFLEPAGRRFFPDYDKSSRSVVAALHASVGENPYDKPFTDLIGELSSRADVFRTLWARHDVAPHTTGNKLFRHPDAGLLELDFEVMPLPGDTRMTLAVFTAAPDSPAADCLALLSSLGADQVAQPVRGQARSITAAVNSTHLPPATGHDSLDR